ncbi:MAG TPA: hypothetical protein VMF10_14790, partial [Candidatus Aquilonibacter sp.]|nr:hypothetical protein [Candidatus Aquilonibacter sp.]
MKITKHFFLYAILLLTSFAVADSKPKLTLDGFFNSVSYPSVAISPDGNSVVIVTERADWDQQIFRHDLWLYRAKANRDHGEADALIQLTQSGHDTEPKWSPDGRWIAFLSDRKPASEKDSDDDEKTKNDKAADRGKSTREEARRDKDDKGEPAQIYLISPDGGEAIQITEGQEEVHTFSWSADSRTIYYATRQPWTKTQKDDYKKQWKDVVQYRTAERGDTIFALDVSAALAQNATAPARETTDAEKESDTTPGAASIATSPLRIEDLITSPDGAKLAFVSNSINQRQEKYQDVEIYEVKLGVERAPSPANAASQNRSTEPIRLTDNQAVEGHLHWASDSRHIFFTVEVGDVAGPYRDLQPHLYWVDSEKPDSVEQWAKDFAGEIVSYDVYG